MPLPVLHAQTQRLLQRDWLICAHDQYTIAGKDLGVPCVDGDWVLVFARFLPFIIVMLIDTHIFYQLTLIVWGVVRGINVLDIGVISNWCARALAGHMSARTRARSGPPRSCCRSSSCTPSCARRESLVREFHNGPARWWHKVMSDRGNSARLSLVALKRAAAAAAHAPGGLSPNGSDSAHPLHPGGIALPGSASYATFTSNSSSSSTSRLDAAMALARARLSQMDEAGVLLATSGAPRAKRAASMAGGKGGKGTIPSDMALILSGQTDEHVAMWDAFAAAWDEIVTDLREADLVSVRVGGQALRCPKSVRHTCRCGTARWPHT